ncbi:MAG: hypothetical protein ACNA7F_08705 [Roseovarius sp.]
MTETAQEAVEAAQEAVSAAQETIGATATEATEAASETAAQATETGTEPTFQAMDQGQTAEGQAPEALTIEGFDMARVRNLIEESGLDAMQKTLLIEGIRAAQDNPDQLQSALEAARTALGY